MNKSVTIGGGLFVLVSASLLGLSWPLPSESETQPVELLTIVMRKYGFLFMISGLLILLFGVVLPVNFTRIYNDKPKKRLEQKIQNLGTRYLGFQIFGLDEETKRMFDESGITKLLLIREKK